MAATSPKNQCPPPEDTALARTLGDTKPLWDDLVRHIDTAYAPVTHQWQRSGKSGQSFLRLIRKQRTICYLLPGEQRFLTAFVFGEKATASVRASDLPASVVTALNEARVYAEGRGIRLETRTRQDIETMKRLAAIKMAP